MGLGYDKTLFSGGLSDINRSVHRVHKKGYQPLKMAVCKLGRSANLGLDE